MQSFFRKVVRLDFQKPVRAETCFSEQLFYTGCISRYYINLNNDDIEIFKKKLS